MVWGWGWIHRKTRGKFLNIFMRVSRGMFGVIYEWGMNVM